MPRTRLRPLAIAGAWAALILSAPPVRAGGDPPPLALRPPTAEPRQAMPPRSGPRASADPGGGPAWWLGPAGVAAALAVFGGASLAARRFLPTGDSGPIRVVGRAALSPKHAACLVRVGDRVLIVGIGPQGAPSTLGEVTDPAELSRLVPRRAVRASGDPGPPVRPPAGFDRRIGDDE